MWNDLKLAVRSLRRAPVFALAAIGTLALGISANTAIFSLFYQVLLRSLPVPAPQELVLLHSDAPGFPGGTSSDNNETVFSYPMYKGLRDGAPGFHGMAARSHAMVEVIRDKGSDRASCGVVSGNYFAVLGLQPAAGRLLLASDDKPNAANPVVILSYAYWVKNFGGHYDAVGKTIRINGQPAVIVGVAPEKFYGFLSGEDAELFVPIVMKSIVSPGWTGLDSPSNQWLSIFGRLKSGTSVAQGLASLQPAWKSLVRNHVDQMNVTSAKARARLVNKTLALRPASQGINQLESGWRKPLTALLAMVGVLLLIACANVANLLVARSVARNRETAIRVAIGAGRWEVMRQTLAEMLLLAAAAGAVGTALSFALLRALIAALPSELTENLLSIRLDPVVLEFSLLLVLVTVLVFGLIPALLTARIDPMQALKDQSATSSASGAHVQWRQFLVAGQLALSLALLIGAGLFAKTFFNLLAHNPGFVAERVVAFSVDAGLSGYEVSAGRQLYRDLEQKLRQIPGVNAVSIARFGPLSHSEASTNVTVEGFTSQTPDDDDADVNSMGREFFKVLGTPIIAGREFDAGDREGTKKVALINQAFAKHFFRSANPLSKMLKIGAGNSPLDIEIVGIVKDTNTMSLREAQKPTYYTNFDQSYAKEKHIRSASFFLRTTEASRNTVEREIRETVRTLAPNVPVFDLKTLTEMVSDSIYTERVSSLLAAVFGVLAMLLAAVGLYGVVAYSVARRTVEIGIRLALGAFPLQVLQLMMKEVAVLVVGGISIGLPAAYGLGRLLSSQLFGVEPNDIAIFASATVVIAVAALLAGLIPAYRASLVDPKVALRYE